MTRALPVACALAVLAVFAAPARADMEWFLSGSLGESVFPNYAEDLRDDAVTTLGLANPGTTVRGRGRQDRYGFARAVRGGLWFGNYVGMEGGYLNFGRTRIDVTTTGVVSDTEARVSAHASYAAVLGGARLSWRASRVYGKAGLYRAKTVRTGTFVFPGGARSLDGTAWNQGLVLGAGYVLPLARHLAVRFDLEEFLGVGDRHKTGEGHIGTLTAGLQFQF